MTTGASGEGRPEPTFADVMHGFSFDSGRRSKRRRSERGKGEAPPQPLPAAPWGSAGSQLWAAQRAALRDADQGPGALEGGSASVRPYAWTRGRTRSGYRLEIETLVSTSPRGRDQLTLLPVEHRAVAELCTQVRSVAEVAALLRVPLGVAKVLVGDMAGLGLVVVHQSIGANGEVPDLALMERVLSGLRRL